MSDPHSIIIEQAREKKPFRCGKCSYSLDGVPVDDRESIVCPECAYTMRFVVRVQLIADDPEYDRKVRQSLGRTERIITPDCDVVFSCCGWGRVDCDFVLRRSLSIFFWRISEHLEWSWARAHAGGAAVVVAAI